MSWRSGPYPQLVESRQTSANWKKATIAAGAVTAYGLLDHNGKATTLGAVATAGSYFDVSQIQKSEKSAPVAIHRHHRRHH